MRADDSERPVARTLLESLIRQRRMTFEEFVDYVETFARRHGEEGTLSVRNLHRLVAGAKADGAPVPRPRPATVRLLERVLGVPIDELLAPPAAPPIGMGDPPPGAYVLRVAVALVVRDKQVLLVRRRDGSAASTGWQFPAGIIKPGMDLESVAVRQTLRETGVHCISGRRLGSRLHPLTHVWCDYLLCEYLAGELINGDIDENVGVAWADRLLLAKFIPLDDIFDPVLDALESIDSRELDTDRKFR